VVLGECSQSGKSRLLYPVLTNPFDLRSCSDRNPTYQEEFVFNVKVRTLLRAGV